MVRKCRYQTHQNSVPIKIFERRKARRFCPYRGLIKFLRLEIKFKVALLIPKLIFSERTINQNSVFWNRKQDFCKVHHTTRINLKLKTSLILINYHQNHYLSIYCLFIYYLNKNLRFVSFEIYLANKIKPYINQSL